jgi:ketosteroid isomerase-like protein
MLLDKALEYFTTFSEKDAEGLRSMFSEDVILIDWEIMANGIDEVVDANQNIFDSVDTIIVTPIKLHESPNTIVGEIEISINDEETILVTDVLEFDENEKIKEIRAYKG